MTLEITVNSYNDICTQSLKPILLDELILNKNK